MVRPYGIGITVKGIAADLSNLGELIDEAIAAGCSTVELPLAELTMIVGARLHPDQLRRLLEICRSRPVRYTTHGPLAVNLFVGPDRLPRHLDVLRAAMEAAAEVGSERFVLHAGYMRPDDGRALETAYETQRELLSRLGDTARSYGFVLCVENIFPGFDGEQVTPSPSRLAAELNLIDHPAVAATLDFGHARLHAAKTGGEFLSEIAALAPHARHLHVHDGFGRPENTWTPSPNEKLAFGLGDLHLPIGWGDTPWDEVWRVCEFPDDVIMNAEPAARFRPWIAETVAHLHAMRGRLRTGLRRAA